MTIQELRAKVKLGLKIVERLEKSAVIPAAVLQRCLPSVKRILCQARLNLLNSDLLTKSSKFLTATEEIILGVWPELEMLIAYNNGSLFDKIRQELYKLSVCPFCGAEVKIDDWRIDLMSDGSPFVVVDFSCRCLTGDSSFDARQERFGLFKISEPVFLGGLFSEGIGQPVIALIVYYNHSLNEKAKAPFGWQMAVQIQPEYFIPPSAKLVWQEMDNLPTREAVSLGRMIDELAWIDLFDLRMRLLKGDIGSERIAKLSEEFVRLRCHLNLLK